MTTVHVHLLPSLIGPESLRGCPIVIVDLLRASTTIVRALGAGAASVLPCLEPDEARRVRESLAASGTPPETVVLGGERGGVRIPGFDLGNSPAEYTRDSVGGRVLVFTTTNGTRALFTARDGAAATVLVGCLNNLAAVTERVAHASLAAGRPAHVICAGTNGEVSQEDVLCAGAMVEGLLGRGLALGEDDGARIARAIWQSASQSGCRGVGEALRSSRGGRNLMALGLEGDLADCAEINTSTTVPGLRNDGSIGVEAAV